MEFIISRIPHHCISLQLARSATNRLHIAILHHNTCHDNIVDSFGIRESQNELDNHPLSRKCEIKTTDTITTWPIPDKPVSNSPAWCLPVNKLSYYIIWSAIFVNSVNWYRIKLESLSNPPASHKKKSQNFIHYKTPIISHVFNVSFVISSFAFLSLFICYARSLKPL